jgi:hypothetical protein
LVWVDAKWSSECDGMGGYVPFCLGRSRGDVLDGDEGGENDTLRLQFRVSPFARVNAGDEITGNVLLFGIDSRNVSRSTMV